MTRTPRAVTRLVAVDVSAVTINVFLICRGRRITYLRACTLFTDFFTIVAKCLTFKVLVRVILMVIRLWTATCG